VITKIISLTAKPFSSEDAVVLEVRGSNDIKLLLPASVLGLASGGGNEGTGTVAAIRMPMLKVADFKGGTPEVIKTSYAVHALEGRNGRARLVNASDRNWGRTTGA
jgi:ethylene receptor